MRGMAAKIKLLQSAYLGVKLMRESLLNRTGCTGDQLSRNST